MIITKTPFRISFFGGGTDYPVWFQENGGSVLASTINRYCHITCRYLPPFFAHRSRIVYSNVEHVNSNEDIAHPAVRAALKFMDIQEGVELHYDGDLPARTGLGSSSAFTVGLLHAFYALTQTMPTKSQLAQEAIHLEQNVLKESVGCQDQILAAYGGLVRINFNSSSNGHPHAFQLSPVVIHREKLRELQNHLMLFFTGFQRTASEIAQEQIQRTRERTRELKRMQEMVDEAIAILSNKSDLSDFGRLLHQSWQIKRSLTSKISTPEIDRIYETALQAGADGGKILGAGGGGFMLLFAAPERHALIREKLGSLLHVPFQFESAGSQVIFHSSEWNSQDDGVL